MRIAIIVPRQLKRTSIYSVFKLPPVGATYIGTVLHEAGHDVEILDEFLTKVEPEKINSDVVGLSVITMSSLRSYNMAKEIKRYHPKTTIIIGGPHATFLPEEALRNNIDFVVRGEGEETIDELINALERGESIEAIQGISYMKEGRIINNPDRKPLENLDSLPFLNYSLVKGMSKKPTLVPMSTSRGCPYNCKFCAVVGMHGRKYRFRSPGKVIEELKKLKKEGYLGRKIFFTDDNFAANIERAKNILGLMKENDLVPGEWWGTQMRVDATKDNELLKLMKDTKAGLIYLGLESINPETLKEYDKKQSVEDVKNAIRKLHKYGIGIFGMFVVGSDHDTVEGIRATVNFCCDNFIDLVQFSSYTPLPGTRLYEEMSKEKRIIDTNWEHYDVEHVVHKPKLMTTDELELELNNGLKRVYSLRQAMRWLLKGQFYKALTNLYFTRIVRKRVQE